MTSSEVGNTIMVIFDRFRKILDSVKPLPPQSSQQPSLSDNSFEAIISLLGSTDVAFWEWHIPSGAMKVSDSWGLMLGYDSSDLPEQSLTTWKRHCYFKDLDILNSFLNNQIERSTESHTCDLRMELRDGNHIWIKLTGRVIERDQEDLPVRVVGTQVNINYHKSGWQRSEKAFAFQEYVSNAVPNMLLYVTPGFHVPFSNAAFNTFFDIQNYSSGDGVHYESFDDEFFNRLRASIQEGLGGRRFTEDFSFVKTHWSGDRQTFQFRILFVPDFSINETIGVLVSLEDKTQYKAAEEVRETLSNRLHFALKASNAGVWDYMHDRDEFHWDEHMCELSG